MPRRRPDPTPAPARRARRAAALVLLGAALAVVAQPPPAAARAGAAQDPDAATTADPAAEFARWLAVPEQLGVAVSGAAPKDLLDAVGDRLAKTPGAERVRLVPVTGRSGERRDGERVDVVCALRNLRGERTKGYDVDYRRMDGSIETRSWRGAMVEGELALVDRDAGPRPIAEWDFDERATPPALIVSDGDDDRPLEADLDAMRSRKIASALLFAFHLACERRAFERRADLGVALREGGPDGLEELADRYVPWRFYARALLLAARDRLVDAPAEDETSPGGSGADACGWCAGDAAACEEGAGCDETRALGTLQRLLTRAWSHRDDAMAIAARLRPSRPAAARAAVDELLELDRRARAAAAQGWRSSLDHPPAGVNHESHTLVAFYADDEPPDLSLEEIVLIGDPALVTWTVTDPDDRLRPALRGLRRPALVLARREREGKGASSEIVYRRLEAREGREVTATALEELMFRLSWERRVAKAD